MRIRVDTTKCMGCRTCELLCSFHLEKRFNPDRSMIKVFFQDDGGLDVAISPDCSCTGDPVCSRFCPTRAIHAQTIDAQRRETPGASRATSTRD